MSSILVRIDHRVAQIITPDRRLWLQQPRSLAYGFIGLHVLFLLALLPTILTGGVLGDLPLYRRWAELGLGLNVWQGIDVEWVYPIGAMLPIALAGIAGPLLYQLVWFLMTGALNALAVGTLTDWGRHRGGYRAAWYWLVLSFLLSPVGLLRLEGLTAPLVIAGLVCLARRPIVATALLTLATWIKVWPAAVVLAVVAVSGRRLTVLLTGALGTAAVAASVWVLDGSRFLAGFVTMQSDRALQLEAPVTTPWVWLAALGQHDTDIYQNFAIATREVSGPGTAMVATLMNPTMFAVIGLLCVLVLRARSRAKDAAVLLPAALAFVGAFVIFNKVGSPQYMLWIAPVVTVGLLTNGDRWRVPAYLLLAISLLTTLVFPVFYLALIDGNLFALTLLTLRNVLLIVLFGWAVLTLLQLGARSTAPSATSASSTSGEGQTEGALPPGNGLPAGHDTMAK